jgi:hypothetical protein
MDSGFDASHRPGMTITSPTADPALASIRLFSPLILAAAMRQSRFFSAKESSRNDPEIVSALPHQVFLLPHQKFQTRRRVRFHPNAMGNGGVSQRIE